MYFDVISLLSVVIKPKLLDSNNHQLPLLHFLRLCGKDWFPGGKGKSDRWWDELFYIRKPDDTWGGRCVGYKVFSGRGRAVDNEPLWPRIVLEPMEREGKEETPTWTYSSVQMSENCIVLLLVNNICCKNPFLSLVGQSQPGFLLKKDPAVNNTEEEKRSWRDWAEPRQTVKEKMELEARALKETL